MAPEDDDSPSQSLHDRILSAAMDLLAHEGRDAVTTRSVCAAAGIQPRALYNTFEDKTSMLQAMVAQALEMAHDHANEATGSVPPADLLRARWDALVAFAVDHPHLFHLAITEFPPLGSTRATRYITEGPQLREALRAMGCVIPERLALGAYYSVMSGVMLTLVDSPRSLSFGVELLSPLVRDALLSYFTAGEGLDRTASTALAGQLLGRMPELSHLLSTGERALLIEQLTRIAIAEIRRDQTS